MTLAVVIGDGAIGVVVAAALADAGLTAGLVGRAGPKAVVAQLGDGAPRVLSFSAPTLGAAELAFVTVKAFDLAAALAWTDQLAPGTPVIPVGNGAVDQTLRAAAERRPQLAWRQGLCTFGVSELGERWYAVRSTAGEVSFGPLRPGAPASAAEVALTSRAPLFRWHADVAALVRRKWLYNTVINSLCAARRLPTNGELLGDLATLAAVFNEAFALAAERWAPWSVEISGLYAGLLRLIERTAANENSMARDRRLGRRTESDSLAGLATDARRYPLLAGLHRQITG